MSTVYFDIDTQIDFMYPAGALYAPGAETLLPTIAALNRKAPVLISTMCEHPEDDPEFAIYGPHCVAGTVGQLKPAALLVPHQILFSKQELDAFANPKWLPLLAEVQAENCVVYGLVTEICVQFVASQLLAMGKSVTVVEDAIRAFDQPKGAAFLADFRARGGVVKPSTEL